MVLIKMLSLRAKPTNPMQAHKCFKIKNLKIFALKNNQKHTPKTTQNFNTKSNTKVAHKFTKNFNTTFNIRPTPNSNI